MGVGDGGRHHFEKQQRVERTKAPALCLTRQRWKLLFKNFFELFHELCFAQVLVLGANFLRGLEVFFDPGAVAWVAEIRVEDAMGCLEKPLVERFVLRAGGQRLGHHCRQHSVQKFAVGLVEASEVAELGEQVLC